MVSGCFCSVRCCGVELCGALGWLQWLLPIRVLVLVFSGLVCGLVVVIVIIDLELL